MVMSDHPADFQRLQMPTNPFIDFNGPLYGRWVEERFTLGFRVESRHCNPANACHGGMMMTLADMTMLIGCNLQGGLHQYLLTVNLTVDFIGPAHNGEWIEGTTDMLRATKNFVFAQGLLAVAGKPVARINGIFKPTGQAGAHPGLATFFGRT
jgi:uncharacterized protein (TIGR00369 family)